MQNIAIQLSALHELKSLLVQFKEEMQEKLAEFIHRLRQLRDTGLPAQIADHYEANYVAQNLQHLQTLVANIEDRDLPYINARIVLFEGLLESSVSHNMEPSALHNILSAGVAGYSSPGKLAQFVTEVCSACSDDVVPSGAEDVVASALQADETSLRGGTFPSLLQASPSQSVAGLDEIASCLVPRSRNDVMQLLISTLYRFY